MKIKEIKMVEIDGAMKKCAILEDGRMKTVNTDINGECIFVDNECDNLPPRRFSKGSPLRRLFQQRVKDMYDTIAEGRGDCISKGNLSTHVVYYLDRKMGEEIRSKFLEGWKNTQFGYAITVGGQLIDGNYYKVFGSLRYATFRNYDEAVLVVNDIINKAQEAAATIIAEYSKKETKDFDSFEEVWDTLGLGCATIDISSSLADVVFDILTDDCLAYRNEQKMPEKYKVEIVQCIINSKEDIIEQEILLAARDIAMICECNQDSAEDMLKRMLNGETFESAANGAGIPISDQANSIAMRMINNLDGIGTF